MARAGSTKLVMLAVCLWIAACSNGDAQKGDAGVGGARGTGGAGGAPACLLDVGAADWFAGVWSGMERGDVLTITNKGGCSLWEVTMGGTLCNTCRGTYVITGPNIATTKLVCQPIGACSVSPPHSEVGDLVQSECGFVYDYDYTGSSGTRSVTFLGPNRTAGTTRDVCAAIGEPTD